jgi:hypothetical protein
MSVREQFVTLCPVFAVFLTVQSLLLITCDSDPVPNNTSAQDTSLVARCSDNNDSLDCECVAENTIGSGETGPVYKVLAPNGGEIFYVGDTVKVLVTSRLTGNARLLLEYGNGRKTFSLPGTGGGGGVDPRSQCRWEFAIPDAFVDEWNPPSYEFSAVSDSVRLRIEDYLYPQVNEYDVSDDFFAVRE